MIKIAPNKPFDVAKWPFFYGWMILACGSLGILMSIPGQTMGVSVFTDSLIEVLHISRDELSLAYMLGTIGSSFILPWAGKQYDKYGARVLAILASIGLGSVLVFLSKIDVFLFQWLKVSSSILVIATTTIGFLFLRFFGQGVLTMASRNMMMEWFDRRRGFATGFSNVFIALSFSSAPLLLYYLIDSVGWSTAWQYLAVISGLGFSIFFFLFYRDTPEKSGLKPDGDYLKPIKNTKHFFPVVKDFTKKEVMNNFAFWVIALMLAMQGLYVTGFTFHVISIFQEAGYTEAQAISIFPPIAVVAVMITLVSSSISDYIPLKYLIYVKGFGASFGILGMVQLAHWDIAYYLIIIGTGIMSGLFGVLTSVTWPRYYGRKHLGAISGQATMMIVFGSALGPILFSLSLTSFQSYQVAGLICFILFLLLTIAAIKADNPQKELGDEIK